MPGMQYAVEQMQKMLDDMREALAGLQNGHAPQRRGRPRKDASEVAQQINAYRTEGPRGYWAKMTPDQRSAEMRRRLEVGKKRKAETEKKSAKPSKWDDRKSPLKVGENYTQTGIAKELGFAHAHSYENWRRRHRQSDEIPRGRPAVVGGKRAVLYSAADLNAIRKFRGSVQ